MRYDRAICVGVDRVAGKCLVQFPVPGGSGIEPVVLPMKYGGEPPAPLTYVEITEVSSGSWICKRSLANVEPRLIEDWDEVVVDASAQTVGGSTSWIAETSEVALTGISAAQSNYGNIQLTTTTGTNDYLGVLKSAVDHTTDPTVAWWLEAKCTLNESTSRKFGVGLHVSGGTPFTDPSLMVVSDTATSSGQARFVAVDSGSATANTEFTPTVGVPFIVQIMVSAQLWAAAWIVESSTAAQDLDTTVHGPFVVTSEITDAVGPAFFIQTLTTAARTMTCDYFRVSTVHPVIHPSEVLSA